MKKHIIIGISTVIILIATICAVTFAAWDITSATIEIGSIRTPDNIQLKVNDKITAPADNLKLVPAGVAKTDKEATIVNMGSFKLNLSSVGKAAEADLAKKVRLNWSDIVISTSVVGINDIASRVQVLILLKDDTNGTELIINNVSGKYTNILSTDEILPNTEYIVAIKFVDGYNAGHDGTDAMIGNKDIKVVVNFNCAAAHTNA